MYEQAAQPLLSDFKKSQQVPGQEFELTYKNLQLTCYIPKHIIVGGKESRFSILFFNFIITKMLQVLNLFNVDILSYFVFIVIYTIRDKSNGI